MRARVASIVLIASAIVCAIILPQKRRSGLHTPAPESPSLSRDGVAHGESGLHEPARQSGFIDIASRARLTTRERQDYLERFGRVPDDVDALDWALSQKTSWWGKSLNPREFWNGRVVWLDSAVADAARRRGRGYPPIPEGEAKGIDPNGDREVQAPNVYEVEGPNIDFRFTENESHYWAEFSRHHPQPPENIARRQQMLARQSVKLRPPGEADTRAEPVPELKSSQVRAAEALGYPPEALTESALFWAYIMQKHQEYVQRSAAGELVGSPALQAFLESLHADPVYVTNGPTPKDIEAANAWKFAYLRRLRSEKTNETYIPAYLQAWNLSEAQVFGADGGH